jgi:hypothetical protein
VPNFNSKPKGEIIVSEETGSTNLFNYYGNNEKYNTVDTLVAGTDFQLITDPASGTYYLNGIRLTFVAKFDTNYTCEYQWKVGLDPSIKTGKSFFLDFDSPVGNITARLITKYFAKSDNTNTGIDTSYQDIYIGNKPSLFGEYEGYNTDSPNHTFKIKIGWGFESHPSVNRSYFYLDNLPEGYPIKSELNPGSSCFAIGSATIFGGQALYFRNEWVNSVYALGFMNGKRDSIRIRYNYGIIANYPYNSMDWSSVVARVFVGKKL